MTRTRTYTRDSRGRFASTGASNTARPKTKITTTGVNRLTRDNAGRITSVGGNGATVRGGRLRTAAGNRRGAIMAQMSLNRLGTIGKPKGLKSAALNRKNMAKNMKDDKTNKPMAAETVESRRSRKKKTELQILQQAERIISENHRRSAKILDKVKEFGLNESLRQMRRNNYRANMLVPKALNRRGLLGKYMDLNKLPDFIHMTPGGAGLKKTRSR